MTPVKKLKAGDYVEVLGGDSAGVRTGEQGIVINDDNQGSLGLMFPARHDLWAECEYGWRVDASHLKLLYRPRVKKGGNQ